MTTPSPTLFRTYEACLCLSGQWFLPTASGHSTSPSVPCFSLPTSLGRGPSHSSGSGAICGNGEEPASFCLPPRADAYLALCCPVGKQGTHPRTSPWSVAQSESGPLQEYLWNMPRASRCHDPPGAQTSGISLCLCSLLTSLSRYGAGWWDTINPDFQACLCLCLSHRWTHIPVLQVPTCHETNHFKPHFPHLMWKR